MLTTHGLGKFPVAAPARSQGSWLREVWHDFPNMWSFVLWFCVTFLWWSIKIHVLNLCSAQRQTPLLASTDNNNNTNTSNNNSHIGHCTCTTESVNVKLQNIFHLRSNITYNTNCKYRTAATLYTQEIWFVSGIYLSVPCIKVITRIIIIRRRYLTG